jgi:hypothetical protein
MPSAHEFRRRVRCGFIVRPVTGPDAEPTDVVDRPPADNAVEHQAFELPFEIGLHERSSARNILRLND